MLALYQTIGFPIAEPQLHHVVRPDVVGRGQSDCLADPAIALAFGASTPETVAQGEALLWQRYDQITAQTLLLRGAESALLSSYTALAMGQRGPKARLVEFSDVGHAPTLVASNQVQAVLSFLFDFAPPN